MNHKKNDLSYSEGGGVNVSNPWGVQLNRLSFKNQVISSPINLKDNPKNPYGYIANNTNSSDKNTQRPQRPKTLKQRTNPSNSSKHTHETSDVIPPPAFASSELKNDDINQNQNQNERAKKRKMRRQLSLAKMQMSVLKARLGLEQMKSPSVINENEEEDVSIHSRSVSVSTENLFATIESMSSFEKDIKDAIDKVDDINKQQQQQQQLSRENKQLKVQLNQIQQQLQNAQNDNDKLKAKLTSTTSKTQRKTQSKIQKEEKEFVPNPLEKYNKMKDLGMSIDAIVNKMTKANIDSNKIEQWKKKHMSQSTDQILASKVNAKEQLYSKYDKMKKIGMPDNTIRNKMRMDGFKIDEIDKYLHTTNKTNNTSANNMSKYDKMKKMGMPQHAIRNKMKLDGISIDDQNKYFNIIPIASTPTVNILAKYQRMRKMGMPTHAIVNKMRLDGVSVEEIDKFENKKKKKTNTIRATDPRLAKYERMTKMGMPTHAIVNKMRLDGIEASLIHKFEHHSQDDDDDDEDDESAHDDDDDDEKSDDDDPNQANSINLNIPALAKYNRMKKMGMPTHAIVNKMKLDGIDANIIAAFEDPNHGKKKKKKLKISNIFHKRKTSIPPKEKIKPNVDMKRFHWQTVDYKAARNSIWKTMNEKSVTKNINVSEFESLFSIAKKSNKLGNLFGTSKEEKKQKEKEKQKQEIKFVSAKRQYNVELLLKRLKFKGSELCVDIIEMNENKLTLELLIKISDMVPNDEEQMQAINNSNKHNDETIAKYGIVERFFYDLSSIWSLQERIKLWIFKKEFGEICQHQLDKINLLNKGLSDIQGSESLYEIFKVILAFGNYMNGGRRNGQAYGFSLETLRMLSGTKGIDGQTTLLMYIFKHVITTNSSSIALTKELENIPAAVRIDIDSLDKKIKEIKNELNKLPKRLKEFEKQTKKIKNDIFAKNMSVWMKSANNILTDLQKSFNEMNERAIMLAGTYAYSLENGAHEFLKIFDDFIKDWKNAKIKYTKLEEKKKKDLLRQKKKEEAQKKLQLKLSKRTTTRQQLAKKNILKDEEKVKKELALKEKLKKTMKAHVRKQTVMKKMFSDVLNQSDEEEEEQKEQKEQQETYQNYIKSYQNNNNNIVHFSPDLMSNVSNVSIVSNVSNENTRNNSRDIPGLSDIIFDGDDNNNNNKKGKKKKKKTENKNNNYANSGIFQKRKAVPTANQFGNVWELNFSPMSRMAYSNSKQKPKKKKIKYKSGHVRRETRLKKAFESMKNADLDKQHKNNKNNKNNKKNNKNNKSNKSNKAISVASPKSKGNEMYSKYRNKNKNKTTNKQNNTMEF